mmetsp:Transcript_48399/g.35612  ORF Transcript_48399/g.35612 Transcript_48399/m.35612 type:complete len:94 (-) Transcript_48399:1222-1503(-)
MQAVNLKWDSLTKEQKTPFQQVANEDKLRYDRELNEFKKGIFQGRSQSPTLKLASNKDVISQALNVSEDIIEQLQISKIEGDISNMVKKGEVD